MSTQSLQHLAERLRRFAARRKLAINERKYPAGQVRGSARRYSDYPAESE